MGAVEAESAFRESPGVFTAGDLIAQAIMNRYRSRDVLAAAELVAERDSGDSAVGQLARYVLADGATAPTADLDATEAAQPFELFRERARAADMRRIVREQPLNSVRWVDLALSHVKLGQLGKARREVSVALRLAPEDRFVLRSAARLFHLVGESDRAHDLLATSPLWDVDPWIQAAEIAIAENAGMRPKSIRRGRELLARGALAPIHTSELAAELATTELSAGKPRPARKLMASSLLDPTENSVAQAEWASRHGIVEVDEALLRRPRSFEARARFYADRAEYRMAADEAVRWQSDQPFAAEPAIFISYVATVGVDDYPLAISAAQRALVSNPQNGLLRNNLVFALACSGRLEDAEREYSLIDQASLDQSLTPTLTATAGLLAIKRGAYELGLRQYEEAYSLFVKANQPDKAALSRLFLAREALVAGLPNAPGILQAAMESIGRAPKVEARALAARILTMLEGRGPESRSRDESR